jgi:NAD(P)-dependent dehydrogenase (short-subunit alcohol dehydrogenase family)
MLGIVTGASRGLGLALTRTLSDRGWELVVDGRDADALRRAVAGLPGVLAVPGDVADPEHRLRLLKTAGGELDLLVNNASSLGPTPLPPLSSYPLDELRRVYEVNVLAPLALVQLALPRFSEGARLVNVTSDAAFEAYETWGGYGSSKAALDHLTAILAAENPAIGVYAFDPGDMRTEMHQAAFPGEDISDRAEPESVVPALLRLLDTRPASGRYRAGDLLVVGADA